MLSKLDIVKGGVAKKDLAPILKHLRIANGWITSTNSRLTVSCPVPHIPELKCIVPADRFVTAMKNCKEPKLKITDTGRLSVTGKGFRALLPLLHDVPFPTPDITGDPVDSPDLLKQLKMLTPFIGNDASRQWANGILLYKNMAYATNNTTLAQMPITWEGAPINLPDFLIAELLRLKRDVVSIRTDGQTITFELEDQVWVHSILLSTGWPNLKELFAKIPRENMTQVPEGLADAVNQVIPFAPDKKFPRIRFTEEGITTDEGDQQASVTMAGLAPSIWRGEPLLSLLEASGDDLRIDFSLWPKPCPWEMPSGLEGLIIGLRQ